MNFAAAQPAAEPAVPPPAQPQNVSEGFGLVWDKVDGWANDFILMIPNLVVACVLAFLFVLLAWGISVAVRHALQRSGRHDLGHMLGHFAYWLVLFLGFLVVITVILPSMQPVNIFASLGIGSVALGFAFKDLLQNWIAGFFILIRRPFHRGDQIKVGDIEGTVQAVETRATLVKTYSGRLVIIPNSDIYTRAVTVHTAYEHRRSEIVVPVGLEVDLEKAMEIFRKAVLGVFREFFLVFAPFPHEPPPDVLPWEFSQNNVNIRVRWWTKSQRTFEVRTRAAVVAAIKRASEAAGIALPADTKISFAATPLIVSEAAKPAKPAPAKKPPKMEKKVEEPPAEKPADEHLDPEAEKPKFGELNEGIETVPR
jgi:small conductance mechanosensitive channel